jgi:hypothetical protein
LECLLQALFSISLNKNGRYLCDVFRLYVEISLAARRKVKALVTAIQTLLFGANHVFTSSVGKQSAEGTAGIIAATAATPLALLTIPAMLPASAYGVFAHLGALYQILFHLAAPLYSGSLGVIPLLLIIGIAVEHLTTKVLTLAAEVHLFFLSAGSQFTGTIEGVSLCRHTATAVKLLPVLTFPTTQPTVRIHSLIHSILCFLQYL